MSDLDIDDQDCNGGLPEGLSADDVFGLLSKARRRHAICALRENEPLTVSELAEFVAARELGKPVGDVSPQERKRVYVSMYQQHLSTLSDAGVVETDEENVVTRGENFEAVAWYLEHGPAQSGGTVFETLGSLLGGSGGSSGGSGGARSEIAD